MPTLDDVYRKFGEAAEAAQLLETELGNVLLFFGAFEEDLMTGMNPSRAAELVYRRHNFRRNSDEGRGTMLADLECIHESIIKAYKGLLLLSELAMDSITSTPTPTRHLPI